MKKLASFGASHLLNSPSLPSSIYWPSQKIKIRFHVFTLPAAWLVFEGAGVLGILSVPEPRGKFGIFLCTRAYMEETEDWQLAPNDWKFFKSQSLGGSLEFSYVPEPIWRRQKSDTSHLASLDSSPTGNIRGKRKLGIFLSLRAYMEGKDRNFFKSLSRWQLEEWHLVPRLVRCFANRLYSWGSVLEICVYTFPPPRRWCHNIREKAASAPPPRRHTSGDVIFGTISLRLGKMREFGADRMGSSKVISVINENGGS